MTPQYRGTSGGSASDCGVRATVKGYPMADRPVTSGQLLNLRAMGMRLECLPDRRTALWAEKTILRMKRRIKKLEAAIDDE